MILKYFNFFKNIFLQNINFRSVLGFGISGILLWFTFKQSGLEWQKVGLHGNQWLYFIGAVITFVISVWVQSLRAKLLWTQEKGPIKNVDTYSGFIIGNFYNCILPGNLGDGVRAYHFSKKHRASFSSSLGMIIVEKWMDAQVFVLLTIILFLIKPFSQHPISYLFTITSTIVLVLVVVYKIMRHNRAVEKKLWLIVLFLLRKLGKYLFRFYLQTSKHLDNLKRNKQMIRYVVIGLAAFALNILQFYLLLHAAGISEPVGNVYTAILIATSMMVIAFIPSAPSNIGVLHYGVYLVLIFSASQYDISPNKIELEYYALFGVYMHLSYFLPEILMGIVFTIKEQKRIFNT